MDKDPPADRPAPPFGSADEPSPDEQRDGSGSLGGAGEVPTPGDLRLAVTGAAAAARGEGAAGPACAALAPAGAEAPKPRQPGREAPGAAVPLVPQCGDFDGSAAPPPQAGPLRPPAGDDAGGSGGRNAAQPAASGSWRLTYNSRQFSGLPAIRAAFPQQLVELDNDPGGTACRDIKVYSSADGQEYTCSLRKCGSRTAYYRISQAAGLAKSLGLPSKGLAVLSVLPDRVEAAAASLVPLMGSAAGSDDVARVPSPGDLPRPEAVAEAGPSGAAAVVTATTASLQQPTPSAQVGAEAAARNAAGAAAVWPASAPRPRGGSPASAAADERLRSGRAAAAAIGAGAAAAAAGGGVLFRAQAAAPVWSPVKREPSVLLRQAYSHQLQQQPPPQAQQQQHAQQPQLHQQQLPQQAQQGFYGPSGQGAADGSAIGPDANAGASTSLPPHVTGIVADGAPAVLAAAAAGAMPAAVAGAAAAGPGTGAAAGSAQSLLPQAAATTDGGGSGGTAAGVVGAVDPSDQSSGGSRGAACAAEHEVMEISDGSDDEGGAAGSLGRSNGAPSRSSPPTLLPAPSLTHLHGYLPPARSLPPLRPGELRLCGITFAATVAPAVRRALRGWEQDTAAHQPCRRALSVLEAALVQMRIEGLAAEPALRVAGPAAAPLAVAGQGTSPAATPWAAKFHRHGLSCRAVCWSLAQLPGLASALEQGTSLPEGPLLSAAVRAGPDQDGAGRDEGRGGLGLFAKARILRSAAIGVLGGYVQPAAAAQEFRARGFEALPAAARAELRRHAEVAGVDSEGLVWSFLAGSFSLPYEGLGPPAPPLELSMLGYGNLTALVNDPRSDPWGERLRGGQADASAASEAAAANCMLVPVCVRGLLLPVLVALHDIAPGEQLLRDYGAAWWAGLAGDADVLSHCYKANIKALLHGAVDLAAYPPAPPPAAATAAAGLAPGAVVGPLQAGGSSPAGCQGGVSAAGEAAGGEGMRALRNPHAAAAMAGATPLVPCHRSSAAAAVPGDVEQGPEGRAPRNPVSAGGREQRERGEARGRSHTEQRRHRSRRRSSGRSGSCSRERAHRKRRRHARSPSSSSSSSSDDGHSCSQDRNQEHRRRRRHRHTRSRSHGRSHHRGRGRSASPVRRRSGERGSERRGGAGAHDVNVLMVGRNADRS